MNRREKLPIQQRLSNTAVRFPRNSVVQHPSNPDKYWGFASRACAPSARRVRKVCSCKGLRVRFCIDFRKTGR